MPPRSSLSWGTEVALAMGAVMLGRWASDEMATCAGVAPTFSATFSTAARIAKPRSFMWLFWMPAARAVLGSSAPAGYLPEKDPLATEEYGMTPMPDSTEGGSGSRQYPP